MNTHALTLTNITVTYNELPVLWNVTATIEKGVLLAIVGPNGAGKTTLIKSILGLVTPTAGTINIFGKRAHKQQHHLAYVPQRTSVDWDFPATVFDVVLMGRFRHIGWLRRPSQEDKEKTLDALAQVTMLEHKDRHISALSGGQQQRVFLARALAQDANIYLMDEPFVGVDMKTEKAIVTILRELCQQGKTILVVHHDLHTLQEYFDHVMLLNKTCIAHGPIDQVCTPEYLTKTCMPIPTNNYTQR